MWNSLIRGIVPASSFGMFKTKHQEIQAAILLRTLKYELPRESLTASISNFFGKQQSLALPDWCTSCF